jgi:uncharacterized RDD family membrane protein YckC
MKEKIKKSKTFMGTASVLKRILTLIIDFFIIYFIIARPFNKIIISLLENIDTVNYTQTIEILNSSPEIVTNISVIIFFISIISLVYFSYMEWKFSQTFGQMIVGLYVISERKEKSIWQYVLSNLFVFPFFPFIILWIVDPLYMFYNGKKFTEKLADLRMEQKYVIL